MGYVMNAIFLINAISARLLWSCVKRCWLVGVAAGTLQLHRAAWPAVGPLVFYIHQIVNM